MRDPNRLYNFYAEIQKIHIEKFPDWRFGQLFYNFFHYLNAKGRDPFYLEENELIKALNEYVLEIYQN